MPDQRPPLRDPDDSETWTTARHEAGHAVAAIALRLRFRYATLRPPNRNYRGAVYGLDLTRPLPLVAVLAAGCAAAPLDEELAGTDFTDLMCTRGRIDVSLVERYASGMHPDAVAQVSARAYGIVRDTHRDAVVAVAAALVHHPEQELTHADVDRIVDEHHPSGVAWLLAQHTAALDGQGAATDAAACNGRAS